MAIQGKKTEAVIMLHVVLPFGWRNMFEKFSNLPENINIKKKIPILIQVEQETKEFTVDEFVTLLGFKINKKKQEDETIY